MVSLPMQRMPPFYQMLRRTLTSSLVPRTWTRLYSENALSLRSRCLLPSSQCSREQHGRERCVRVFTLRHLCVACWT